MTNITDQELYLQSSYEQAELLTRRYSSSFSQAVAWLGDDYRDSLYAIYGMVRLADEIVDAGFDFNTADELEHFSEEIYRAIDHKFSANPVLHAFQHTIHTCSIERQYIESFLRSMRMDVEKTIHTDQSYKEYIYGSAEVVGIMSLAVFCKADPKKIEQLVAPARALGSAFQKVNFLRDIQADALGRKRMYFPNTNFEEFNDEQKRRIEEEILLEYAEAAKAIPDLPPQAARGVGLALAYYRGLLQEIQKISAQELKVRRVSVPTHKKLSLAIRAKFLKRY